MLVSCRINHKSNVKRYKFVFFWLQSWSTSYLKSRTSSRGEDTTLSDAKTTFSQGGATDLKKRYLAPGLLVLNFDDDAKKIDPPG